MELSQLQDIIANFKCRFGYHVYSTRWSKREKVKAAFNETAYMQFKTCSHCGVEKSRLV